MSSRRRRSRHPLCGLPPAIRPGCASSGGEQALTLPPGELVRTAKESYRAWRSQQPAAQAAQTEAAEVRTAISVEPSASDVLYELNEPEQRVDRQVNYEQANESARAGIEEYLDGLSPYQFQDRGSNQSPAPRAAARAGRGRIRRIYNP